MIAIINVNAPTTSTRKIIQSPREAALLGLARTEINRMVAEYRGRITVIFQEE